MNVTNILYATIILIAGFSIYYLLATTPIVQVIEPDEVYMPILTKTATTGHGAFIDKCSECHGLDAGGSEDGPTLIHRYYDNANLSDNDFFSAVATGVKQEHWEFGDMKPVAGVTREEVVFIIKFVREVQRANGIY